MIKPQACALCLVLAVASSLGCGRASAAHQAAEEFLAKKVVHCGDSVYTLWDLRRIEQEQPPFEFRDFDWEVEPKEISEADRLNGITFHGFVVLSWSAHRSAGTKWGEWKGSSGKSWSPFPTRFEVLEKNDKWTFPTSWLAQGLDDFSAPDCAAVNRIGS